MPVSVTYSSQYDTHSPSVMDDDMDYSLADDYYAETSEDIVDTHIASSMAEIESTPVSMLTTDPDQHATDPSPSLWDSFNIFGW